MRLADAIALAAVGSMLLLQTAVLLSVSDKAPEAVVQFSTVETTMKTKLTGPAETTSPIALPTTVSIEFRLAARADACVER